MTTIDDWIIDVADLLDRLDDLLDRSSGDQRAFVYARDLLRLMTWLRTQPRSRVLLWATLGTAAVIGLVLVGVSEDSAAVLSAADPDGWTEEP